MKIKEIIGIDVSKLTLDSCDHNSGKQEVFDNNLEAIEAMVDWSLETTGASKADLLFVFEHTGLYSHQLIEYLSERGYFYYVVPGLEIKRSLGIVRGKDDKVDAKRIALYGYRLREEIKPSQVNSKTLESLKRLMSMRRKLVAQRAGHKATLKEQQRVLNAKNEIVLFKVQKEIIKILDVQIKTIEKELSKIIKEDSELQKIFRLITSIKGIGPVTARFLIVYTAAFTKFKTWRKFASYCGIAPFPNCSGTSVRGRTKLSNLANKEGKWLLHLCAVSAIQNDPEMKLYYERRVEKGKNKMSTLNIIRNKLLGRAFAVVQRGTPYVDTMKYAA
jgi:transposase